MGRIRDRAVQKKDLLLIEDVGWHVRCEAKYVEGAVGPHFPIWDALWLVLIV